MKNTDTIQTSTPIAIAVIGAALAIITIFAPTSALSDDLKKDAFGLSSILFGIAGGLAQGSKQQQQDFSVEKQGDSFKVETPSDDHIS